MKCRNSAFRAIAAAALVLGVLPMRSAAQVTDAVEAKTRPNAASKSTPRAADGHPDLNGVWHRSFDGGFVPEKTGQSLNFFPGGKRAGTPIPQFVQTKPPYKPELLAKVEQLKVNQTKVDPAFYCGPPGVPRIGPPNQIIQNSKGLVFLYSDLNGNFWRVIPTDGLAHYIDADSSFNGVSAGYWEGDTLVVDVTNFNNDSWLGDDGLFHSTALHVIERLKRQGDTLLYLVTVDDPKVFTQPWVMTPRTLTLQDGDLEEAPPCKEKDANHLATGEYHGNAR
jgi:hypothetical protein